MLDDFDAWEEEMMQEYEEYLSKIIDQEPMNYKEYKEATLRNLELEWLYSTEEEMFA